MDARGVAIPLRALGLFLTPVLRPERNEDAEKCIELRWREGSQRAHVGLRGAPCVRCWSRRCGTAVHGAADDAGVVFAAARLVETDVSVVGFAATGVSSARDVRADIDIVEVKTLLSPLEATP